MKKIFLFAAVLTTLFFSSCAVSKKKYNPDKKFSRQQLQQDYTLLKNILEKKHPSLYWYTPKDSMAFYFDSLQHVIADSMTELQFGWQVLAPLTQKIRCGHTSFSMSRNWYKFTRDKRIPSFPLLLKVWGDTMLVTANLNRKDSVIKTGTVLTSINGTGSHQLLQQMFRYLPLDGYSDNVNYIRISSSFPYFHRNIFGIYKNYRVGYIDSTGIEKTALLPMWVPPPADTGKKNKTIPLVKPPRKQLRKERKESYRTLAIDSTLSTATMTLNTFSTGGGRHLRSFIKQSFRKIRQQRINNFILDLRSNGGGEISMYTLLAKYIRHKPFKVADTAFAAGKSLSPYTKYVKQGLLTNLGLLFLTKKQQDGYYHFGFYERKTYRPKKKNHFNGKVYVLVNGPTFSASTLLCNAIKGQSNVTVAGEEAGGGWHGNNGIMIPDIVLPNTKIRVRLPLFRLVQYNHVPKDGRGLQPDIYIPPVAEAVKKGIDRKMEIIKGLIKSNTQ
jgi:hypothetical protein